MTGDARDELAQPMPGEGRRVIARLADELLPTLIARLDASGLGELEVHENGWRVRLRRPVTGNGAAHGTDRRTAASAGSAPERVEKRPPLPTDVRPASRRESESALVTSPAVGYFIPRDGLSAGTSLRAGDLAGHVDVLGVRQEVVVPADGILIRLEVEPGEAVEYGQPIARLEPITRD